MYLDQDIKIDSMAAAAEKTFESTDKRLKEIESNFHSRMGGRTMGGVIGAFLGTALWIAGYAYAAVNLRSYLYVDNTLFMAVIVAIGLLLILMVIDELLNFSYFGKVSSYGSKVKKLKSRVGVGHESISANKDAYMKTKDVGWNYRLTAGESIPDEAAMIERSLNSMDSLKKRFLYMSKNGLYFLVTILITVIGSMALFPTAMDFLGRISSLSDETTPKICWVGMIVACICEIFVAKLIWSRSGCYVGNMTLFGIVTGPIVFSLLLALGTLIVVLVYLAIQLVMLVAGAALALFCFCASISGG